MDRVVPTVNSILKAANNEVEKLEKARIKILNLLEKLTISGHPAIKKIRVSCKAACLLHIGYKDVMSKDKYLVLITLVEILLLSNKHHDICLKEFILTFLIEDSTLCDNLANFIGTISTVY